MSKTATYAYKMVVIKGERERKKYIYSKGGDVTPLITVGWLLHTGHGDQGAKRCNGETRKFLERFSGEILNFSDR